MESSACAVDTSSFTRYDNELDLPHMDRGRNSASFADRLFRAQKNVNEKERLCQAAKRRYELNSAHHQARFQLEPDPNASLDNAESQYLSCAETVSRGDGGAAMIARDAHFNRIHPTRQAAVVAVATAQHSLIQAGVSQVSLRSMTRLKVAYEEAEAAWSAARESFAHVQRQRPDSGVRDRSGERVRSKCHASMGAKEYTAEKPCRSRPFEK